MLLRKTRHKKLCDTIFIINIYNIYNTMREQTAINFCNTISIMDIKIK